MEITRINKNFCHVLLFLKIIIHFSYSSLEKDASLPIAGGLNHTFQCRKWNATIFIKSDSLQKFLQATFQPFSGYERCFTYYNVYLHLLKPNHFECNLTSTTGIKRKTLQQYNQRKQNSYKVNFTDLKAGYYCIMIKPCAERCYETLLASNVARIEETLTVTSKRNVIKEATSSKRSDVPYISVILVLTLVFSVIIYWSYKHRKVRKIPGSVIEKGEDLPFLKPCDTEVFILYYSDGDTKRLVDCLADFLQECAEFNVTVIDDRHAPIHFEPYSWLDEHLRCCSTINGKCTCNRKVIIVMTESVINYIHCKRKVVKDLNGLAKNEDGTCTFSSGTANYDDMQADWFCYGLDKILIDWSRCLKDYSHFFVIYFDNTLYDEVIMIAPNVRFSIQRHLLKLCQELNCTFNDAAHKNKLMKCLDKHPIKDIKF